MRLKVLFVGRKMGLPLGHLRAKIVGAYKLQFTVT